MNAEQKKEMKEKLSLQDNCEEFDEEENLLAKSKRSFKFFCFSIKVGKFFSESW